MNLHLFSIITMLGVGFYPMRERLLLGFVNIQHHLAGEKKGNTEEIENFYSLINS